VTVVPGGLRVFDKSGWDLNFPFDPFLTDALFFVWVATTSFLSLQM